MSKLVVYDQDGKREIELEDTNSLGRLPENSIHLNDRLVSKNHCVIFRDTNGGYRIRDLGSLNGTYVNNKRIEGEIALENGDEIIIATTSCLFLSESPGKVVSVEDVQSHVLMIDSSASLPAGFLSEKQIQQEKVLRTDYEKLRVAIELIRDIGLERNINRIFDRILASTFEYLDCDSAVILMEDSSGELVPQAFKTRHRNERVVIPSAIVKRVQDEKIGLITGDAMTDGRFSGSMSVINLRLRSSMAVPILDGARLRGIMIIKSSSAIMAYTEQDLQFFTNIAQQTAQLIKMAEMAKKIEEDAAARERFRRLLSPDLAEMVVSGKLRVEKGGENRTATVLFADIRGFTSMCENMEAAEVLNMLNEYFELMVDVAFRYEGTVDKFVGDMIMVIWGAPIAHDDDPIRAVKAAIDMQAALAEFNRTRDAGQKEIHVGMGINTDQLVAGYIGSSLTMSYSVIGDSVNLASRLCSVAGPDQILISENTYRKVQDYFQTMEYHPVRVKGKAKPVNVYGVIRPSSTSPAHSRETFHEE